MSRSGEDLRHSPEWLRYKYSRYAAAALFFGGILAAIFATGIWYGHHTPRQPAASDTIVAAAVVKTEQLSVERDTWRRQALACAERCE